MNLEDSKIGIPINRIIAQGPLFLYIVLSVLIVAVVIQVHLLWDKVLSPLAIRVEKIRGYSALERSAILHIGDEFVPYLNFLRDTIPPGGRVILPPHSTRHSFTNFGFAAYFLMPRELLNCGNDEVEACILRMTGHNSYIPVLSDFPPSEIASQVKRFVPFQDDLGVWVPK